MNAAGCSLDDLVPCSRGWKNHGAYLVAYTLVVIRFYEQGLLRWQEAAKLIARAALSSCGKKFGRP